MLIAKKSTREIIYEALVDAYNTLQMPVTRDVLSMATNIKKTIIDEHLDGLIKVEETVIRVERGLYAPVIKFPETRAISRTVLPGGLNKLEIGTQCIDLTPAEARIMNVVFGGANEYRESEAILQSRALMAQMATTLTRMQREINALRQMTLGENVMQGKLELM